MKIKLEIELKSGEEIDDIPGLKILLESNDVYVDPETEEEDLKRQKKVWWESVDEIIFLYLGLSLSFAGEAMGNVLRPTVIWSFSVFILVSTVIYVIWKWNYAFADDP